MSIGFVVWSSSLPWRRAKADCTPLSLLLLLLMLMLPLHAKAAAIAFCCNSCRRRPPLLFPPDYRCAAGRCRDALSERWQPLFIAGMSRPSTPPAFVPHLHPHHHLRLHSESIAHPRRLRSEIKRCIYLARFAVN